MKADSPQVYLYHLLDETGSVRYVGCSVNPYARVFSHYSERRYSGMCGRPSTCSLWFRSLHARDIWPTVRVIRIVSPQDSQLEENREIRRLLKTGAMLVNSMNMKPRTTRRWDGANYLKSREIE